MQNLSLKKNNIRFLGYVFRINGFAMYAARGRLSHSLTTIGKKLLIIWMATECQEKNSKTKSAPKEHLVPEYFIFYFMLTERRSWADHCWATLSMRYGGVMQHFHHTVRE